MTDEQSLEQAVTDILGTGDASASSQDEGQKAAFTNEEAKQKRISDAEWQRNAEEANEAKSLKEKLREALSDAPSEVTEEDDLPTQVRKLKELNERKDWEIDNPQVRDEKYKGKWKEVNSNQRLSALTYEEKWKLIRNDESSSQAKEELRHYEKPQLATPSFSNARPTNRDEVNDMTADLLRRAGLGKVADQVYKV